jgi:L-2-hydroxyglutarate oxidase
MERTDLLVVGAGIVGLAAARAWKRRHPRAKVTILEKEPVLAAHGSGRNSGVLHAGFLSAPDSRKAELCVAGNVALRELCTAKGLPIRVCGKLVVARDERELGTLHDLLARGERLGVRLRMVDADEVRRIEPRARTVGRALWSPDTAVVDPAAVVEALAEDLRGKGVTIALGRAFSGRAGRIVTTAAGPIRAERVLNCAGLHADRVAAEWGAGAAHRLVPFVGRYLASTGGEPVACCVYPVPDPSVPFLGVHVTPTPDGRVKLGPTAIPARWREDYGGLSGFARRDVVEQLRAQVSLFLKEPRFRAHAASEALHRSRTAVWWEAARLVDGLRRADFRTWSRPGVRAQLVHRASGRLVHDFVVESAEHSVHVLNAVSPAFTASLPFGEELADALEAVG